MFGNENILPWKYTWCAMLDNAEKSLFNNAIFIYDHVFHIFKCKIPYSTVQMRGEFLIKRIIKENIKTIIGKK